MRPGGLPRSRSSGTTILVDAVSPLDPKACHTTVTFLIDYNPACIGLKTLAKDASEEVELAYCAERGSQPRVCSMVIVVKISDTQATLCVTTWNGQAGRGLVTGRRNAVVAFVCAPALCRVWCKKFA